MSDIVNKLSEVFNIGSGKAIGYTVVGFVAKSLWDLFWKNRQDKKAIKTQKKMDYIEKQLSLFYWPLYFKLQKNNTFYNHYLGIIEGEDSAFPIKKSNFMLTFNDFLHNKEISKNHVESGEIIEKYIYLADMDSELESAVLQYVQHIVFYKNLVNGEGRSKKDDAFFVPYPEKIYELVTNRLNKLKYEYNKLIGEQIKK